MLAKCIAPVKRQFVLDEAQVAARKKEGRDGEEAKESNRKRKEREKAERERQRNGERCLPEGLKVERNVPRYGLLWDLRGNYHRFATADAVLAKMGITPKHGYKQKPPPKPKPTDEGTDAPDAKRTRTDAAADGPQAAAASDAGPTAAERGPAGRPVGAAADAMPRPHIDFSGKLYLAPLTTVGNLPFRRVCKRLGADITCSEMALATNLVQGHKTEWALLRRHPDEDMFGAQIAGGFPDALARCADVLIDELGDGIDFIDVNCGCPIDLIVNKGAGSALLCRPKKLEQVAQSLVSTSNGRIPITLKLRTGYQDNTNVAHEIVPLAKAWGVAAVTLHGRSRAQRYSRLADWSYVRRCSAVSTVPMIGNGDIYDFEDYVRATAPTDEPGGMEDAPVASVMVARGALVKPWVFKEIKERRRWDISSSERFTLLRDFVKYGFEHWGADDRGVETTRRFLLEWLSYLHRYIPVGLLEVLPQRMNWRPPYYHGRDDLETLMASERPTDWIELSTRLIGRPPPQGFRFTPKHKSSSYEGAKASDEGANG